MKKVRDVVSKGFVKNKIFNKLNKKVNAFENKTPDATTLIHINQYITGRQILENRDVDEKDTECYLIINYNCS